MTGGVVVEFEFGQVGAGYRRGLIVFRVVFLILELLLLLQEQFVVVVVLQFEHAFHLSGFTSTSSRGELKLHSTPHIFKQGDVRNNAKEGKAW